MIGKWQLQCICVHLLSYGMLQRMKIKRLECEHLEDTHTSFRWTSKKNSRVNTDVFFSHVILALDLSGHQIFYINI